MTVLDQLGNTLSGVGWGALGNIVFYVALFTAVILFLCFIMLLVWWRSFNIKVKIYSPIGQVNLTDDEKNDLLAKGPEEVKSYMKAHSIKYSTISYKNTKGKFTHDRGVNYFQIFSPYKRINNVPMSLMYDDGVHIVRLARNLFAPIQKPNTIIDLDTNVEIFVKHDESWNLWNRMAANSINARYQDIDAQKKVVFYFVVGIIAMVLVGGFLLWLIYKSAIKGFDNNMRVAQQFTDFAKGLGQTAPQ